MATTRSTEDVPFISDDRSVDFDFTSESQDWATTHPEVLEVQGFFGHWNRIVALRNVVLPHPTALLCFMITFTVGTDLSQQELVVAVKDEGIRAATTYMTGKNQAERFILFALREILRGCGVSVKEELKRMNADSNPNPLSYIRTCAMLLLWIIEGVDEVKLSTYLCGASGCDLQSLFLIREFAAVRALWAGRCQEAADWTLGMLPLFSQIQPPADKMLFVRMALGYSYTYLNREDAEKAWKEANIALKSCYALPEIWVQVLADAQREDS